MPLSRERVLDEALDLVDVEGLSGLTMRALATRLGVEAPSLYKHVANKEAILDGLCERIYGDVVLVDPADDWSGRLNDYAAAFRASLLRHRNLVSTLATRPVATEGSMALVEFALTELTDIGFDPETARRILNVIVSMVIGLVLSELSAMTGGSDALDAFRSSLDPETYPLTRATVASTPADHDAEFTLAMTLIIDGLKGMLDRAA